jgi:adenosylcobinamide-phosphate synthase
MTTEWICISAVIIDALLGESRRFHPLVGFGHWANWLESRLNTRKRWQGVVAVRVALLPFVLEIIGGQSKINVREITKKLSINIYT